jgi:hypothetical protein
MHRTFVASAFLVAAWAGAAGATATREFLGVGFGSAISADGTVVVGNTPGDYETFRWTAATGMVPLGRATVPVLGVGAGIPDVSADGTRVSATILGADSTYATQGLWTLGEGWQETMPPPPPDGGLLDASYGSSWGLSGDGGTVVGLYWRPGQPGGSAHASAWTSATGVVDLGGTGQDSRANDCDADGDVVVGWASAPTGAWQPTVWVDGVLTTLEPTEGFCEAEIVTPEGTTVFGTTYEVATDKFFGAAWDWDGSTWNKRTLGALPGTAPSQGYVAPLGCTPDGGLVVGYNRFFWGSSTGFVWTEADGMVDVVGFAASLGIPFPANFDPQSLTAVSDDGSVLLGYGQDLFPPFQSRTFLIRLDAPVAAPQVGASFPGDVVLRAWPNPSRGATTFSLEVPRAASGTVDVHDVAGRLVRRLADGPLPAGTQSLRWDGRDETGAKAAAGVYYLRLAAGDLRGTEKLVMLR